MKKTAPFDFSKKYILENDFIQLSPLNIEHIPKLLASADDPEIWTHFFENGCGFDNLSKYVHRAIENRNSAKEYPFVVYDKIQGLYAGMTRIYEVIPELGNLKIGHTWIGKQFHGTGLNKNCKYLLFEFVFETLGMSRIGFGASAENIISIKAMESVGCKQEGMLRSFSPKPDGTGRMDIILLSILKEEWNNKVKFKLKKKLRSYKPGK